MNDPASSTPPPTESARLHTPVWSTKFAFLGAIFALVLLEIWVFFSAEKSCGFGWGFYGMMLSPMYFVYLPWVSVPPLLVSFAVGGFFLRKERASYWILASVLVLTALCTFILTPEHIRPCSPL